MSLADVMLQAPATSGYIPRVIGPLWSVNSQRPPFRLVNVEQLRLDPQIQFGMMAIRAPLADLKWTVRATSKIVGDYVDAMLALMWQRSLRQFVKHVEYGHLGGEPLYARDGRHLVYDGFKDLHPLDCTPLQIKGKLVGIEVKNVHSGLVRIGAPRMVWLVHEPDYSGFYGKSKYEAAWVPWMVSLLQMWT